MATAKKLPSGSYRVRIFVGEENGKKIYKSFTAPKKKEAEHMATTYMMELEKKKKMKSSKTFSEEFDSYIAKKEAVLSPATIAGYKRMKKQLADNYPEFVQMPICDIEQDHVQNLVNDMVKSGKSPKTIYNKHGLISAVLGSNLALNTTMPQKIQPERYIPTDEDIKKLVKAIRDTELEIPVLLGAFGMMRRGEICGLSMEDIQGTRIHVHHSLVLGDDNEWHLKPPKNTTSDRYVDVPQFVIDRINEVGHITTLTPNAITSMLRHRLKKYGIPHFRFHDLRHYSASIRHALGIPDAYIMEAGGWKTDNVLKSVYRHAMSDKQKEMSDKANNHFKSLF